MSNTARSFLLFGALLAVLVSQYAVAHALGHEVAFAAYPTIVPEPTLLEHPLVYMALLVVAFGAFLELLVGDPIPFQGWIRPIDRAYSGQHSLYLCIAAMALIAVAFTFVLVRDSSVLQSTFWWIVLALDALFGLATGLCVYSWLRTSRGRSIAAE